MADTQYGEVTNLILTPPAMPATFTLTAGKTLSVANTLTLSGTDGASVNFLTGGSVAYIGAMNSWVAGVKQTFAPSATTAGINVGSLAGDPSAPANGDLWYDSTANELTARINGVNVSLSAGGGGGTVTSVSVTTANGVSGSVANPTTTPAITLTLGAITPSSVASTGAVSGTTATFTGVLTLGSAPTTVSDAAGKILSAALNTVGAAQGGTGVANNAASTLTISGNFATTLTVTGATGVTLPVSGTLATLAGTETFTNKTLTAPDINAGTADSLTSLSIRSTGAAFDLTIASTEVFTAGRTLTIVLNDANRTLTIAGNATISGTNTGDQTNITGNAGTATALQTARTINGVNFDGTANITVTAAAGTLTGTTLNATVVTSSLTTVGALASGSLAAGFVVGGVTMTLGSDATGDVYYRNSGGVLTRLGIGSTGNVLTVAGGLPSWAAPATGGTVTSVSFTGGLISVANPTTTPALTVAGTSGGVVYFSSTTTWASSALLAVNQIVLGGGAGAAPATLGSLGTTITVLHGNAAGAPTFGAVSLTADVSGILPGANGGTGNGFFAVSGPTASLKTFAFPDASATVLTTNAAVTVPQGGTGNTTFTAFSVICAGTTATGAFQNVSGLGTAGFILTSNGAGALPTWQAPATAGTVTSVSVVTANGFAGTVATATSTPAITLTTTITGILSGNGTAISAASTTGTGAVVLANTPTLITPVIGVATGTSLTLSNAGNPLSLTNTTDASSVQVALLQGDRATVAGNDEAFVALRMSDGAGTQVEIARLTWAIPTTTAGATTGRIDFSVRTAGTFAKVFQISGADIAPSTDDGLALGNGALQFSDLFLASGAVINFNNGDVTITHASNLLTFAGGAIALGVATVSTINGLTITTSTGTLTIVNGSSLITAGAFSTTITSTATTNSTLPAGTQTLAGLGVAQTFTATQTMTAATSSLTLGATGGNIAILKLLGNTSGTIAITTAAAAGTWTWTLPVDDGASGQFLQTDGAGVTSWQTAAGASGLTVGTTTITSGTTTRILYDNAGVLGEYTITGTGTVVVMQTSPNLITPALGVATATSINGLTITATTGTITITNAKVLSVSNTLTFTGTDSSSVAFGAGGTVDYLGTDATFTGIKTFTPTARSSGIAPYLWITAPADTNLTASTEAIGVLFTGGTRQHATGALTTQREFVITQPIYSFVGASTITNAATFVITNAPVAGTNATITNGYALWVQSGKSLFGDNLGMTASVTTGTGTSSGFSLVANSLTTGNGLEVSSSSITTGNIVKIISTSTVGNAFSALNIDISGVNGTSGKTVTGQTISVTNTQATSGTNVGLTVSASGATTANYAALFTAGSVGIGNSAPASALHVGAGGGTPILGAAATPIFVSVAGAASIGLRNTTNSIEMYWSTSTASTFFGASTAHALVLITSNTSRLTISSAGAVQFNTGYGIGAINSDAAGNLTSSSDERLKIIEGFFTRGLESLKEIRPIFYKWRPESGMETETTYAGMGAQNVRAGIPEAATPPKDDPNGMLSLSERAIIGVLINSCNQLRARVEYLESAAQQRR